MPALRVARRDWRMLTGRSPDSRRVPGDRRIAFPPEWPAVAAGFACVMRLAPFTVAGAVPGWRATRAPASRLARACARDTCHRGHSGEGHRDGQAAFDGAGAGPQCGRMANSARLDAALAAATEASAIIRAHYAGVVLARTKADGSPVTDADIAAERAIRAHVVARFPDDGFYGEETAAERLEADRVWLVDPIDGTKSFVRGYPMFSTQIAVMHRGRLELGVSSAPAYGETAWAERGAGAFQDGAPLA